mgnify:CR=1 FL=1
MAKHRILVQWIGHSDLRALAASLSQPRREKILSVIKGDAAREGDLGPTRTLLSGRHFDEVHLLSTYDSEWNTWFQDWLELRTELVEVKLERPTDYSRIFEIALAFFILYFLLGQPIKPKLDYCQSSKLV